MNASNALLIGSSLLSLVATPADIYLGHARQLNVRVPRIDAPVVVDGHLNEEQWSSASVLSGFSQFAPSDGVPAADSTQVLVWYSPTAIHFGIRAFEQHGPRPDAPADQDGGRRRVACAEQRRCGG